MKIENFDFHNILINEKSYKNISFYVISCKTLIGEKPLRIRFNKAHGFILGSLYWDSIFTTLNLKNKTLF